MQPDYSDRLADCLGPELQTIFEARGKVVDLSAGTRVFGIGASPQAFLLLLKGSVKVRQFSSEGREVTLYHVKPGQTCILTTACLLGQSQYLAEAVTECNSRAVVIPAAVFEELIDRSAEFRRYVFRSFGDRLGMLLGAIDRIAFTRVDARLARLLLEASRDSASVRITQSQLAAELGTAREVISRVLGRFRRSGWVHCTRGGVEVLQREALSLIAGE